MNKFSKLKICEIEKLEDIKYEICRDTSNYSLPKWYDSIRDKRLYELNTKDIAISVRQNIFLRYIIPEALKRLGDDPTIGDQYYGEVLTSLYKIDHLFGKIILIYWEKISSY